MKLGFGLYRHMLNREHYRFARQCGATHLIVHLVDYFRGNEQDAHDQPRGGLQGWGYAGDPGRVWSVAELRQLKAEMEDCDLQLWGIENFDPAHWHDILLDGPKRAQQIELIKQTIRHVGEAGIGVIGYNFSLAGVAGRGQGVTDRGQAECVAMNGRNELTDTPLPLGMVWNMVYDRNAPPGSLPSVAPEELWRRIERFLQEVLPVAEAAGVRLAYHPDDPPLPSVRGQPRLVYQPSLFQRLLALHPSPSHALELCLGTVQEMTEGSVYDTCAHHTARGEVAYIHLRNVKGKVPHYRETFIDDGDLDVLRVLRILKRNRYDGLIIPDHAPQMTCPAPWYAGMAFAMGYLRAAMTVVQQESEHESRDAQH